MVPIVVALVPERAQVLKALRIHMKRRECDGVIVTQLRGVRRCNIDVGAQALTLAISVQLAKVLIERTILLQGVDDVFDGGYICRSRRRIISRLRRVGYCAAATGYESQAKN